MNDSVDRRAFWTALGRCCAGALLAAGGVFLARRNGSADCPPLPCRECGQRRECRRPQREAEEPREERRP